jgi:hypothetical protein
VEERRIWGGCHDGKARRAGESATALLLLLVRVVLHARCSATSPRTSSRLRPFVTEAGVVASIGDTAEAHELSL